MLQKIKNGVITIVMLSFAIAAALYFFNPTGAERDPNQELVILKVWWEPIRRMQHVNIAYTLNGHPGYHGELNESPWVEQFYTSRGTIVALGAMQSLDFDPSSLHCSASTNGRTVSDVSKLSPDDKNICAVMIVA